MPKHEFNMIDLYNAKIVEITVDNTGKLWVNIDGKCALRIGHCEHVVTDNHVYGRHDLEFPN